MKLGLILVSIIVLLSAAPAEGQSQIRSITDLNLRSCPQAQCSRIRTLENNTHMEVLKREGEWVSVRVAPTGETGWVNGQYVEAVVPSGQEPEEQPRVKARAWSALKAVLLAGFLYCLLTVAWGGPQRARMGFWGRFFLDWRVAASVAILLASGVTGVIVSSSLTNSVAPYGYSKIAFLFAYSGWASFWGLPSFLKWCRKMPFWMVMAGSAGCGTMILLVVLILPLGFLFSFSGGGLVSFAQHVARIRGLSQGGSGEGSGPEAREGARPSESPSEKRTRMAEDAEIKELQRRKEEWAL